MEKYGAAYTMFSRLSIDQVKNKKFVVSRADAMERIYYKTTNLLGDDEISDKQQIFTHVDIIKEHEDVKLHIDSVEMLIISDYLLKINVYLQKYNIATSQSQPSWYVNDILFQPPYCQLPFVEITGNVDSWGVLTYILYNQDHKLDGYHVSTHYSYNDEPRFSLCIMKTHDCEQDYEFDDTLFWIFVCEYFRYISELKIQKQNPINDLRKDKSWYILDNMCYVQEISHETQFYYGTKIPISSISVRYGNDIIAFTQPFDPK